MIIIIGQCVIIGIKMMSSLSGNNPRSNKASNRPPPFPLALRVLPVLAVRRRAGGGAPARERRHASPRAARAARVAATPAAGHLPVRP